MNDGYLIATVSVCFVAFAATIAYILASAFLTPRIQGKSERATLFNTFPGELTQGTSPAQLTVASLAGISALTTLVGYLMLWGGLIMPANSYTPSIASIFLMIFSCVAVGSLACASYLPLSSIRGSLVSWMLGLFFTVGVGLFSMMVADGERKLLTLNPICTYVAAGLSALLLLTLLNPRIKDWSKMQKAEENGTTYWLRPKVNYMAVSVWASYLVQALLIILFAIGVIVGQ